MKLPIVKTDIQIRFADLDTLGHVSNNIYGQYFEVGRIAWFDQIQGDRPATVVANVNIDYISEVGFRDSVYVETACIKKGNKSLQLSQNIYCNGNLATKCIVVLVGFNKETRKSCVLLEGWEPSEISEPKS